MTNVSATPSHRLINYVKKGGLKEEKEQRKWIFGDFVWNIRNLSDLKKTGSVGED